MGAQSKTNKTHDEDLALGQLQHLLPSQLQIHDLWRVYQLAFDKEGKRGTEKGKVREAGHPYFTKVSLFGTGETHRTKLSVSSQWPAIK